MKLVKFVFIDKGGYVYSFSLIFTGLLLLILRVFPKATSISGATTIREVRVYALKQLERGKEEKIQVQKFWQF